MDEHQEKKHINRIKGGDTAAFGALVDHYRDLVYTLCLRMLTSGDDAQEAAQDVFVKAFRSIHQFQGKSRFSTWLYRITYNQCISVIRKKVKVIDLVDEIGTEVENESDISAIDRLSRGDRSRYLQLAIESLPETDGLVVTLFYYEELSLDEIAEVTGLTSNNIRIKLHRSRKKMYQVIRQSLKSEVSSIL